MELKIKTNLDEKSKIEKISQPFFLKHEKFSIPELIDEIISGIRSLFDYFFNTNISGINLCANIFLSSCFNLYIDPRSGFSVIQTIGCEEPPINPFFPIFKEYLKTSFLNPKIRKWDFEEIRIYFSLPLIKMLGSFDFIELEDNESHSNIFDNTKLDRIIFIYKT